MAQAMASSPPRRGARKEAAMRSLFNRWRTPANEVEPLYAALVARGAAPGLVCRRRGRRHARRALRRARQPRRAGHPAARGRRRIGGARLGRADRKLHRRHGRADARAGLRRSVDRQAGALDGRRARQPGRPLAPRARRRGRLGRRGPLQHLPRFACPPPRAPRPFRARRCAASTKACRARRTRPCSRACWHERLRPPPDARPDPRRRPARPRRRRRGARRGRRAARPASLERLDAHAVLRRDGDDGPRQRAGQGGARTALRRHRRAARRCASTKRSTCASSPNRRSPAATRSSSLSADELDTLFHDGQAIDLGAAIADSLALGLDPYPRSANAAERAARGGGDLGGGSRARSPRWPRSRKSSAAATRPARRTPRTVAPVGAGHGAIHARAW